MQLDLSKWNPFKFIRKSAEERRSEPATPALAATDAPAGWPGAARSSLPDPLRLMQDLLAAPLPGTNSLGRWFGDFSPAEFQPRVDIVDDGGALRVTAELPGMDRDDVELIVEDDYLVLRGQKRLESEREEQGCYRLERAFGSFQRVIPLPDGIDATRAEAQFENGMLTVRIPKLEQQQPEARRVEIH